MNYLKISLAGFASVCAAAGALAQSGENADMKAAMAAFDVVGTDDVVLRATPLERFSSAWAMAYLPDGRAIVSEKEGNIWLLAKDGSKSAAVANAPNVDPRGQGGMGDFIVHPDFAENGVVFLSYVERDGADATLSGAVVERAELKLDGRSPRLAAREVIWRQSPKVRGNGHYGHRLAAGPVGDLFITSGERQKFTYAQNMATNLGKVIRITQDGETPEDNPFRGAGGPADAVWTLGHRNPLGIDFDAKGRLWIHEMGPLHGDELNLIVRAENYGYPNVSNGDHYTEVEIPDHSEYPIYFAPGAFWVPAISPAGFVIYDGEMFADWRGDGFIGGLSSKAIIRVEFDEEAILQHVEQAKEREKPPMATEAARYSWDRRVREIEEGPDGALFILEDGDGGRLLKLEPKE